MAPLVCASRPAGYPGRAVTSIALCCWLMAPRKSQCGHFLLSILGRKSIVSLFLHASPPSRVPASNHADLRQVVQGTAPAPAPPSTRCASSDNVWPRCLSSSAGKHPSDAVGQKGSMLGLCPHPGAGWRSPGAAAARRAVLTAARAGRTCRGRTSTRSSRLRRSRSSRSSSPAALVRAHWRPRRRRRRRRRRARPARPRAAAPSC